MNFDGDPWPDQMGGSNESIFNAKEHTITVGNTKPWLSSGNQWYNLGTRRIDISGGIYQYCLKFVKKC